MRLLVTGVNGFIGSHLVRHWCSHGQEVYGAARKFPPSLTDCLRRQLPWKLGAEIPAEVLADCDTVVHLAYDRGAGLEANVEGVLRVFDTAAISGVPRQIFVSSYSARPGALSEYGRLKHRLETHFLDRGQTVVRPGLVIGDGGLFGRNMATILRTRVMPLLNGGVDLLPVIALEDLVAAMTAILDAPAGAYNLFQSELVSMRTLVGMVNRAAGHRALCINIPAGWALRALPLASRLGVRLPVDADNLRALEQNQEPIHESHLGRFVREPRTFEGMIRAAVMAHQSRWYH